LLGAAIALCITAGLGAIARETPVIPKTITVPKSPPAHANQDAQLRFVAVVEAARQAYQAGGNDMAKGAARPQRARQICAAFPGFIISNWIGSVATLSSNNDGKGVLSVSIGPKIYVKT